MKIFKSRKWLVTSILVIAMIAMTGCFPPGATGIKASGGGTIDSLTGEERDVAALGFNVQITQEPNETVGDTEVLEAKGRCQVSDPKYGFVLNADVTGVLYCDVSDAWPDHTIYFYGVADPDKKVAEDEVYIVAVATSHLDGSNEIRFSVQDYEGHELYSNSGVLNGGNISVKVK